MRTETLLRALAADTTRSHSVEQRLMLAMIPALALATVMFLVGLGPRPDFAVAIANPQVILKFVITLSLAATAIVLACRMAKPACATRIPALLLLIAPALLVLAVLTELVWSPPASWRMKLVGTDLLVCLVSIPLLALPMLVAALLALRHGAPLRPALAGAVAGLLAGGLGAALYAFYCPNDSPLYGAAWYSLAIAGVAIAGSVAGRYVLRW
jgi:hypothetical protein